ncbi:MAG: fasciclin domain-containing protein, partial [Acidimicrobiia bacterium]
MADNYGEPEWSEGPEEASHTREPLFWLFIGVAALVVVLAVTGLTDDGTDASFASSGATNELAAEGPTPAPLPTAQPTPTPAEVPAIVEVRYAVDSIELVGTVPAQAIADALVSASAQLVGQSQVRVAIEVDPESSLSGGAVVIVGEIDDEQDRQAVLVSYANVGLVLDDRLIIAGSNLTIAEILSADPNLSQVTDFLNAAGVLNRLEEDNEEGITIFVPTNDAVTSLDTIALDELADATELTGVLEYHLVEGTVTTRDLATVTALPSVQGESIPVEALGDGSFRVGDALILTEDIDATNGVVHVVDAV